MKLNEIYERIGALTKSRKNKKGEYVKADIAKALHVEPQDISNWAFRNKFPWEELFSFSQEHSVSYDWLLTGEEKQADNSPPANESFLADLAKTQAETIAELQRTVNKIHESIADLGGEIGDIKTRMYDTAMSGEIKRLGLLGDKRR